MNLCKSITKVAVKLTLRPPIWITAKLTCICLSAEEKKKKKRKTETHGIANTGRRAGTNGDANEIKRQGTSMALLKYPLDKTLIIEVSEIVDSHHECHSQSIEERTVLLVDNLRTFLLGETGGRGGGEASNHPIASVL